MKNLTLLLAVSALALAGCQKNAPGGVAVIDLDRVAGALGWTEALNAAVQSADKDLRAQLDDVLRSSQKTIDEAKAAAAADAKLTEEQIATLNSLRDTRELNQLPLSKSWREKLTGTVEAENTRWQNAVNAGQQQLQQRKVTLIAAYREKIRPVARRKALDRGMTSVIVAGDALLLAEPSCDITDAVIDEMQKTTPRPAVKPAPVGVTTNSVQ